MKIYSLFYDTLICIGLTCVLIICYSTQAHAARSINTVTLNGSNTVSVSPAQTVTVAMEVTVSDNGNSNRWYATYWEIGSESGCIIYEEAYQDKTATEIFTVTVPSAPGTYSGIFTVYGTPNCNSQQTTSETLNNAITVEDVIEVDYHFDESGWTGTAGEVQDSSGNDFHATAVNGPLTSIVSPAIPGNPGTCSYGVFDGENDYVALPPTYPDITKSYTITAWIRTQDNTRSGQRILIDDPNNSRGFGFSLGDGGTGRVRFFSRNTSPIILDTDNVIKNGNWYFVAAVANLESKIKRIYVFDQSGNKITDASGSYTGDWGFDDGDASMGGENDASGESSRNFHFEGDLDEIRVHEGALSETAISEHQNRSRFCFSQAAEYRFDLCSETNTVIDDSGNGFNGTVLNGPLDIQSGAVCNAGYFDGVDDYVVIDDRDAFDGTSALTITGWINPENIRTPPAGTNARGILSKRNNASSAVSYGIFFYSSRGDGKLYVDIDTVNNRFASDAEIQEDVWTHFAVVFNGKLPADERVKLYLNGNLDRTASESSTTIPDYNSNLYIGNLYYGTSQLKVFQGMLDEIRIVPEVLSEAEVQDLMKYTRPGCQSCGTIDHIRIEHTGVGLTCQRSDIVLRACSDASCLNESTDAITVSMTPVTANQLTWIGGDDFTFTGTETVQLRQTIPGIVNLGITNPNPAPTNGFRCYDSGVVGDCDIEFFESGFIFDVPDHIADVTQNVTMSSVRKDLVTEQCVPGFQNETKNVSFWSDYRDPGSGTLPVRVDSTLVSTSPPGPGTLLSLDFDNNGEVVIPVAYADVGQMNLNALYQGSGDDAGLVMTGVDSFITRPDHFNVTVPGNLGAADASGPIFGVAGELFQVEVSAINASGNVTPNYGNEAVAESVQLNQNLLAPAGQNNPLLGGSFDPFGTNCNGNAASGYACGQFSWEEVGIIELIPAVADGNYLGTGNVVGNSSGNVGRFIPDRFAIADNSPQLGHGCVSGSFTYLGQEFGFLVNPIVTVTALGSAGAILSNYGNSFWKYSGLMSARAYSHGGLEAVTVNLSTAGAANLSGNLDYDGTGTVEIVGDLLTYVKPAAPIAPFITDVDLVFSVADLTDGDGVCYDSDNDGICGGYTIGSIGNSEQCYGRLQLQNAYGPETLPLTVPVLTEFYSGTAFVLNDLDSCTAYDAVNALLGNYQPNLVDGDTSALGNGNLVSGIGNNLILTAPGIDNEGSVDLTLDLSQAVTGADMVWLQFDWDGDGILDNPTAKATFGIFKGNQRLIYMRESIW